jgi:AcrR family transcriptional regulator
MAAVTTTSGPRHLGRPRDEDRTPAILAAAKALLGEVGYDRLRIQDVADRAGAGLATLYRRWPTKQALICDAICAHGESELPPVDDDPRADLLAIYGTMADALCDKVETLPGMIAAMRAEPEVAEVIRSQLVGPLRDRTRNDLARIVGDDHPLLDLLVDVAPSVLMYRSVFLGESVSADEFLAPLIALVDAVASQPLA